MQRLSLVDRLLCAAFAGAFGAGYGAILALSIGSWRPDGVPIFAYVKSGASVFAALGLIAGPFVADALAGVLHFFFAIWASDTRFASDQLGVVWALFWLGAGTVITILVVRQMF